jgi:hypothetical protein
MEQENTEIVKPQLTAWNQVTPLSKYLAMTLFVAMPFIGGWIGYTFAPEKIVEVEKVIIKEAPVYQINGYSEEKSNATSTWNIYRNDEFGFEISYPSNWRMDEVSTDNTPERILLSTFFEDKEIDQKKSSFFDRENMFVGFQIDDSRGFDNLDDYDCEMQDETCASTRKIINGIEMLFVTGEIADGVGIGDIVREIQFLRDGKSYEFYTGARGIPQIKPVTQQPYYIDQIASTFRFID